MTENESKKPRKVIIEAFKKDIVRAKDELRKISEEIDKEIESHGKITQ